MAEPTGRVRPTVALRVLRTLRLSRHLIRVVTGGDGLAAFHDNGYTDRYIKLVFPRPGVCYPEPFRMDVVRREMPASDWPQVRTYTVREYDPDGGELTIDIGYRGAVGLGGPWAAAARPGDRLLAVGPGGGYAPDPGADWHLLVGDESALPAVGAAMERVPGRAPVLAVVEVDEPGDEQRLPCPGDATVHWLHRRHPDGRACGQSLCGSGPAGGGDLLGVLRELGFPAGRVHAFVHGEAGMTKGVRRLLLQERGVSRQLLSVSGYWRRGLSDDQFRVAKASERAAGIA